MIEIRVLGPLDVKGPGGRLAIVSESQRRLVSCLALKAGIVVRGATLENCLDLSAGAVRTSISRLRPLLGPDALTTTPPGYTLDAQVDVAEFDRLASAAPTCNDEAARDVLERALRLWRDSPLIEFASEPWASSVVTRLHEAHATVVEDLAVLQLDAGETAVALSAMQVLIDEHPYRDRPRALMLRALDEAGRRTEALRSFQAYRTLLLDEIGTEPSSALAALDRAIASADSMSMSLAPIPGHPAWTRTRAHAPTTGAAPQVGGRLPVQVSSFIGQSAELATVSELVGTNRLVTLVGAGGCGKTRLALAVAENSVVRHPGGTWWTWLAHLTSGAQVHEQVAQSVGLPSPMGIGPSDELVRHLERDRTSLLVLDNAEHVLEPVASLTAELLSRCPALRVLITSREPIGLAGEVVWRVPSLDSSDARSLFLERAMAARSSLVVDDGATRQVDSICAELDGLPLAIELAAARTRTLPLGTVAQGVGDALRWQSTGIRSPLAHHATLHASISWSIDLLDPDARTMLTRLSVFESAFTLESAAAVGGANGPVDQITDAVSALVDASLLELDDVTGRYRMLRIVRQFCAKRAHGTAELEAAHALHARHLANWCTDVGIGRHGIERGPLLAEMPDVVAATVWARRNAPAEAMRMCTGLASVRSVLGYYSNLREMWDWLMSLDRPVPDSAGWAAAVAALMAPITAQGVDASVIAEEVRRLLPEDRLRERGWLARGAAMVPAYRGHVGPIIAHAEEAASRSDEMGISIYGGFAAYMLSMMGRRPEVTARLDELGRLTRRRHTTFSVDTVGNGYAAAVLDDVVRGELRSAARRATDRVPDDPAFSMTAAAALAQVALLTDDASIMSCAIRWSQRETIPMLRFLPTLIDLLAALMDGSTEVAADLAERYWDESSEVPVSRCHPLPILTSALVASGRRETASSIVDAAGNLADGMDPAPWLDAGVLHGRAQLALDGRDPRSVVAHAQHLADLAATHAFRTMAIDALEFSAAAHGIATPGAAVLAADARSRRDLIGYRWRGPGASLDLRDGSDALL